VIIDNLNIWAVKEHFSSGLSNSKIAARLRISRELVDKVVGNSTNVLWSDQGLISFPD